MRCNCFVCNAPAGDTDRGAISLFTAFPTIANTSPSKVLSEIFDKTIPESDSVHSPAVCNKCYKSCMEYVNLNTKLQHLKTDLTNQFKKTLPKHGYNYNTYPNKTPVRITKKVVLPASKLQPLPPDFILNVGNIPTTSGPVITNVTTNNMTKLMKVTAAPSTIKPKSTKIAGNTDPTIEKTVNNTLATILNSNNSTVVQLKVDSVPKEFMTSAVLTRIDNNDMKIENDDEIIQEENTMEIDEECTLVEVAKDVKVNDVDEDDDKSQEDGSEKAEYLDMSLLPLNEDEDNEDTQTIVVTGENGSILRIMSGQKLVYENGEITLADEDDDDNSTQGDNNDEQDSNEESQIELQVSGDEETANAIIAAAKEQGGAFIKVESGEMFRVKSVQSKAGDSESYYANMVEFDNDTFKCLICRNAEVLLTVDSNTPMDFKDAESMMNHLKTEHGARLYICQICNKIMRKRTDYTAHMDEHPEGTGKLVINSDKPKMHECGVCKKKYNSRTLLQEHMNVHNGTRPYVCSVCNKSFASKYTHQAHMKIHLERPRPFKCQQCPKSFFTSQNLQQHEKTHLGIKDFICNVCNKAFASQHNLEVHGVVHSGRRPYVCGVCGKGFARRAEVRDHMRIHTGERPFSCEVCGAQFSQRSNLHSHRRATHLDDKRYHCPHPHCGKRFKRRRLLEYHLKALHTGERPLQCAHCPATFVYPEHYKKHARIHSGEKPYVCEVCGKSFNSRDNRNTHRFVHSDKKPYECLVCGTGYMRKQLLYAHMNTSGHLAEYIVINQPRVQKVNGKIAMHNAQSTERMDKLEAILVEPTEEIELESNRNEDSMDNTPKLILTSDKKFILQSDGLESNVKTEGTIQNISAEQLGQVQMITSDENGEIRLVQLNLNSESNTWVVNQ